MTKNDVGISVQFVQQWTPDPERESEIDHAFAIAVYDTRAIPFGEKFRDACAFLEARRAGRLIS